MLFKELIHIDFWQECTTLLFVNPNLFKLRCPEQFNFRTKFELYFWIVVNFEFRVYFGNDIELSLPKHRRKFVSVQQLNLSFLEQIEKVSNCPLITPVIFLQYRNHDFILLLLQLNLVMIFFYFYFK